MGLQSERIVILSSRTNASEKFSEMIALAFQGLWHNEYTVRVIAARQPGKVFRISFHWIYSLALSNKQDKLFRP